MADEKEFKKKIKNMNNITKIEKLSKFIAFKSGNPDLAIQYGMIVDDLMEQIEEKDKIIDKLKNELREKYE